MAITLDELLGRNTQSVSNQSTTQFPSYENFKSSRNTYAQSNNREQNNVRYNFDMAPAQAPRSVESVRNYEANRPYVAPQSSEYQTREYPFYDNLRANSVAQPVQYQAPVQTYEQPQYVQAQTMQPAQENFYEFTAHDSDRLSDQELYDRLAYGSVNQPAFNQEKKRTSIFARNAEKTQDMSEQKQRARLNTKGKIILGVYIAVIALVASLIIVNATKINEGKAVTPTSKVGTVATQNANNTESFEIDSKYEVRI